jgi:hypothetical protein
MHAEWEETAGKAQREALEAIEEQRRMEQLLEIIESARADRVAAPLKIDRIPNEE